jgi:hypothetical protein
VTALRVPDVVLGRYRERDTPILRATVTDNSDPPVVIPGSALGSITLTLYDEKTLDIINERTQVDVQANVDETGAFVFELTEDDMKILSPTRKSERRRILLEWTWASDQRASYEMQFVVENVAKVGSPS